jgi:hypothetical protein
MKRNLIYHCYFKDGEINEFSQLNLMLLSRYIYLFNGEIIINIAVDDLDSDHSKITSLFTNLNYRIVKNEPENRESEYFIDSIKGIKNKNSLTFFAHNKGGSIHELKNIQKLWTFCLYFFNLEPNYFIRSQDELMNDKVFSGILRITTPCPPSVTSNWHYSGSFFWFNTEKLLNIDGWDNLTKSRFAVERFPGSIVDVSLSHSGFVSENFNFNSYSHQFWNLAISKDFMGEDNFSYFMNVHSKFFKK